jgi:hypothetical protein
VPKLEQSVAAASGLTAFCCRLDPGAWLTLIASVAAGIVALFAFFAAERSG